MEAPMAAADRSRPTPLHTNSSAASVQEAAPLSFVLLMATQGGQPSSFSVFVEPNENSWLVRVSGGRILATAETREAAIEVALTLLACRVL